MRNIVIIAASVAVIIAGIIAVRGMRGGGDPAPASVAETAPALPQKAQDNPLVVPPQEDTQNSKVIAPSFDVVRVSREGTGVIAGRAAPDSDVTVLSDDKVIGRVTANKNGEWVLIFQEPLKPGSQELSLMARKGSAAPIASSDIVVVNIPAREDKSFTRPPEEGVVAVLTPRDGQGASRVLQQPNQGTAPLDDILTVDTMDFNPEGKVIMTGRAMPETEIRVYLDGKYQASVTTNDQGHWTFAPKDPVGAGEHRLRLDQILDGDNVRLRIEQPFNRETKLDRTLAEGQVEVQPGNNLWAIARRIYGAGVMYTLIFQQNKGRIVDPNLIYPNQLFKLPRATDAGKVEEKSGGN